MEIILGKTAGFCYGVKRAVDGAKEEIAKNGETYCLGEIVHNKNVVKSLQEKGMKFIENIDEAKATTVIRAHGVAKEVYEKAKKNKIELVDLTCPNVLKIHDIADEYCKKGYYIILVGTSEVHPEVIGIMSFAGENSKLVKNEEEIGMAIKSIEKSGLKNVLIISQTTCNSKKFDNIAEKFQKDLAKSINLEIKKTVCMATETRQKETKELAQNVDCMIIIGDKKSSNTNKLYDISCEFAPKAIFIENYNELNLEELPKTGKIGIMAGASTPKEDIDDVIKKIENSQNGL